MLTMLEGGAIADGGGGGGVGASVLKPRRASASTQNACGTAIPHDEHWSRRSCGTADTMKMDPSMTGSP